MAVKIWILLTLGLIGFAAFTLWRAAQSEARAAQAFPPEGQILDVDGIAVHAVVMGDGPDVVLIHGSSGNTRDMTFALAPILAKNYRVIVFDRPGLAIRTVSIPKVKPFKNRRIFCSVQPPNLVQRNPSSRDKVLGGQ
ncbi:hypothetical protein [Ruegeria sp.]|uniref:hypothetical protein n=1 Tax=Ruegeria sp. TaxID=1879320 RepID=UPI003AFF8A2B